MSLQYKLSIINKIVNRQIGNNSRPSADDEIMVSRAKDVNDKRSPLRTFNRPMLKSSINVSGANVILRSHQEENTSNV